MDRHISTCHDDQLAVFDLHFWRNNMSVVSVVHIGTAVDRRKDLYPISFPVTGLGADVTMASSSGSYSPRCFGCDRVEPTGVEGDGSMRRLGVMSTIELEISARVCNLVRIGLEEVGKPGRGRLGLLENEPQLSLLGGVPRAHHSRGLSRDLARRPHRDGGARCDLFDDQVSAPIEIVFVV
ncbi:hypothetical protein GW17_00058216 [Ensete ventricosum]|nr:hypothetical protein GW17_00058216 [Ensete ventricosum]